MATVCHTTRIAAVIQSARITPGRFSRKFRRLGKVSAMRKKKTGRNVRHVIQTRGRIDSYHAGVRGKQTPPTMIAMP